MVPSFIPALVPCNLPSCDFLFLLLFIYKSTASLFFILFTRYTEPGWSYLKTTPATSTKLQLGSCIALSFSYRKRWRSRLHLHNVRVNGVWNASIESLTEFNRRVIIREDPQGVSEYIAEYIVSTFCQFHHNQTIRRTHRANFKRPNQFF